MLRIGFPCYPLTVNNRRCTVTCVGQSLGIDQIRIRARRRRQLPGLLFEIPRLYLLAMVAGFRSDNRRGSLTAGLRSHNSRMINPQLPDRQDTSLTEHPRLRETSLVSTSGCSIGCSDSE
jgi:hypothetical protein